MRRLALIGVLLILTAALILVNDPVRGVANQALATNTKRPTATDTLDAQQPKAPAADGATSTRTLVPSKTALPSKTPLASKTPTNTPTITSTPGIGPYAYPDNINSLTGLPFPDDAAKNRRNLIVKVSNYPWIVRPQSGLSKADVVYEYEVEGGVTRFAAIFRSQGTEHLGPIRSARLPDLELVPMYNALLAFSGANTKIFEMIQTAEWHHQAMTPQWGDNCPPFCRFPAPGLPTEHTMFGNTFQMWDLAARRNVNTGLPGKGFAFAMDPDPGGKTASDIAIKWYGDQDARWQYNPGDNKYYRWNTGVPHIDRATGEQLTADNVVIIQATHKERPDIYENEDNHSKVIEIDLTGQEKAYVFRDGKWFTGIWKRRSDKPGNALGLFMPDGQTPINLHPGNTWVEVVRCCSMYGVKVSDQYENVDATAAVAAITATFRGPHGPADPAQLAKENAAALQTQAVSAATQGYTLPTATGAAGTPTPDPANSTSVGMTIPSGSANALGSNNDNVPILDNSN